jgi:hypothetical protein
VLQICADAVMGIKLIVTASSDIIIERPPSGARDFSGEFSPRRSRNIADEGIGEMILQIGHQDGGRINGRIEETIGPSFIPFF